MRRLSEFGVFVLVLLAGQASAGVLFSSYNTPCTPQTMCSYEGGPAYPTLAQQLTVTSALAIASIDAALAYSIDGGSYPASDLQMEIVNDSSGAPGNTVFGTDTGVTGTLTEFPISGTFADINFAFGGLNLNPGTYWLVIGWGAASPTKYFDWEYQVPGTPASPGAGGVFDPNSYFGNSYSATTYMATVNGSLNSVPEPATAVMVIGAFATMWGLRRRNASR